MFSRKHTLEHKHLKTSDHPDADMIRVVVPPLAGPTESPGAPAESPPKRSAESPPDIPAESPPKRSAESPPDIPAETPPEGPEEPRGSTESPPDGPLACCPPSASQDSPPVTCAEEGPASTSPAAFVPACDAYHPAPASALRELLQRSAAASAEIEYCTRRIAEIVAAPPRRYFMGEPLPEKHLLKGVVLDIFNNGVVPHVVKTHVSDHRTVAASPGRPGMLRTFGVNGWATLPAADVAEKALDNVRTRLELMWRALVKHDVKGSFGLRPALSGFVRTASVFVDGGVFDLPEDREETRESRDRAIRDIAAALVEYAI